jgi:signal-transduction protein with cAMP-binding, CBS, and nucleotidyltransferase domain
MCVMNHTTGPDDVTDVLDWFAHAERPSTPTTDPVLGYADRRADLLSGWGQTTVIDEATARRFPLFAELDDHDLELVVRSASELRVDTRETVVQRWHGSRHFYAILEGSVEIHQDEKLLVQLDAGEFFGELAALDWGAGFGYVRTATVIASSPARLLVLPPAALAELVRTAPEVERQIRAAARERLQRV